MIKKSLLALVCALGLTIAPEAQAMETVVPTTAILYEIFCLFRTITRDPKPDRKQRPLVDMSRELFKKDRHQWIKNAWQNLVIVQEDYIEGQGFKDNYAKVKRDNYIKGSRRKCYQFGIHGNLLSYLIFIGKTRKSMKDLAFLIVAIASLYSSPVPTWLSGHDRLRGFLNYCNWSFPEEYTT